MTVQIIATGEKLKTSPEYGLRLIEQGKAIQIAEAPAQAKPAKKGEAKAKDEAK